MHAATRAGAVDPAGREALLRYVLRPPVAQERVEQRLDGLVRITLKRGGASGAPSLMKMGCSGRSERTGLPSGFMVSRSAVMYWDVRPDPHVRPE